jgi:hypothetical protein
MGAKITIGNGVMNCLYEPGYKTDETVNLFFRKRILFINFKKGSPPSLPKVKTPLIMQQQ